MDLDCLHEKIRHCQLCILSSNRIKAVPGEGPCPAEIMLVGEAPGREEDLEGRPFVGRAGRLLDKALEEAGLQRSEVFITSVIKCRPPDNRRPKSHEIESCRPYLEAQMMMLNPRIVCLMGNVAIQAVLGKQGVTSLRARSGRIAFL